MTWRKLKGILQEHPYLIDDAFHMPMKQAMDLQESEGYPSFEEMALRAKRVSTAPASAWVPVDAVIARRQRKQKSLFGLRLRPPTKVALVGLCLLLLASYLAFAPSGRAFATYVAKIVMQIVENGFSFTPIGASNVSSQSDEIIAYEETTQELPNFDEAVRVTGRHLLHLYGDMFTLKSLTLHDNSILGSTLSAIYETPEGLEVELKQRWRKSNSVFGETNPNDQVWEEILWDGTVMYCLIDEDGLFNGLTAWQDTIVNVYAEEGVHYKGVLDALRITGK